jgi:hypothetical protein
MIYICMYVYIYIHLGGSVLHIQYLFLTIRDCDVIYLCLETLFQLFNTSSEIYVNSQLSCATARLTEKFIEYEMSV